MITNETLYQFPEQIPSMETKLCSVQFGQKFSQSSSLVELKDHVTTLALWTKNPQSLSFWFCTSFVVDIIKQNSWIQIYNKQASRDLSQFCLDQLISSASDARILLSLMNSSMMIFMKNQMWKLFTLTYGDWGLWLSPAFALHCIGSVKRRRDFITVTWVPRTLFYNDLSLCQI